MHLLKPARLLLVLLIGLPVAMGDSSSRVLAALVQAKTLLGADSWSMALQLETKQTGRPVDSALVFEFAGALWLYRPIDGTQSLSRHWNNVAEDRERLLELLRRIDPTYQSYREYSEGELAATPMLRGELPNGCFIKSAAEARRLRRVGQAVDGCLLSYYVKTANGLRGHTVLCFEDTSGTHLYDPAEGRAKKVKSFSVREQAMDLARWVMPAALTRGLAKAAKIMIPTSW